MPSALDFRCATPQLYFDSWRNVERMCRYKGRCVACQRRCYGFDDGENDPRGILGEHAVSAIHPQDDGRPSYLETVTACFSCMNNQGQYNKAIARAREIWGAKAAKED